MEPRCCGLGLTSAPPVPPQSFQELLRDVCLPLSDAESVASMDSAGDVQENRSVGSPSIGNEASSWVTPSSAESMSSRSTKLSQVPRTSGHSGPKPKRKRTPVRVRIKTARRREQCRVNQARYRENQNSSEATLGESVGQLRRHIQALLAQRQLLIERRVTHHDSACQTVAAMFDTMQHGLTTDANRARQLAVIAAVNHPDVYVDDTRRGHTAVIEQWHCFSTLWGRLWLQLCRIDSVLINDDDGSATLRGAVRMELTVTPQTIQHVFPHLMRAPHLDLQRKLLGQRLVCDVATTHIVNDTNQITRVEWTVDFVTALLPFVSLYEASIVLQVAKIEHDAYLNEPMTLVESEATTAHVHGRYSHKPAQRYPPGRRFAALELE